MKAIQTGSHITICDDSLQTWDQLPAGTYMVSYSKQSGCFLERRPNLCVNEKAYGVQGKKIEKVLRAFAGFDRSLGVILSGDKGIGKSMFAKQVCIRAEEKGYPVILIDSCVPGLGRFIESIDQECVVFFDEFDKTFRSDPDWDKDDQAALLSLFDGAAGGKKLYLVTCNELYGLNSYIVNRPGRFHYHFRFDYPEADDVREYLTDKLTPEARGEIEKVVDFSRRVSLNYDCLRAIAFELNEGETFSEAIGDLNIMTNEDEQYRIFLYFDNGKSLHNFRYRTNLLDIDGTMDKVSLYNDDGEFVLDAWFDKAMIRYDFLSDAVTVDPKGLKILPGDYADSKDGRAYAAAKPTRMTFSKCAMRSLHYKI